MAWCRNIQVPIEDMNTGRLSKTLNRMLLRYLNQKRNVPAAWMAFTGETLAAFFKAAGIEDPTKQRAVEMALIQELGKRPS